MQFEQQLLRPAQVGPLLGISTSRVYQLIGARVLPAVRVGGAIRVPRSALEEWLQIQARSALSAVAVLPESSRQAPLGRPLIANADRLK
jgi:excisionase family DNA binding protein